MPKYLFYVILFSLTSGCASKLKVTVNAADRTKVEEYSKPYFKNELLSALVTLENFSKNIDSDYFLNQIFKFVSNRLEVETLDPVLVERYTVVFNEKFGNTFDQIDFSVSKAREGFNKDSLAESASNIDFTYSLVKFFKKELSQYKVEVPNSDDISETFLIDISSDSELIKTTISEGKIRTRFPILGDPLTPFITKELGKKDTNYIWGNKFNKTVSFNLFGNADIAIILRSNPPEEEFRSGDYNNNFTIKGVRVDAADATNALMTGLTQTMNFIANTQGLPTLNKGGDNLENPVPEQNSLVIGLNSDKTFLEIYKRKFNNAQALLLEKINVENVNSKNGIELKNSIIRIEEYWEILKKELNKNTP